MINLLRGTRSNEIIADCSLLFIALTWGSTYVIVKKTLETTPVFSFIFMRYALAALFLLCFNLSNLRKIDRRLVLDGTILGTVLFLGYSLQTLGLRQTSAPIMAFTTNLYVVIVPFLQWILLKIRPRQAAIAGVALAVIGLGFITQNSEVIVTVGIVYGIFCALFYALHITLVDRYSKRNNSNLLTLIQLTVVTIFSVIASRLSESYIWPESFNNQLILAVAITGILGTSVAFIIMLGMQKHTTPTKAAIIYMMESPFSIIFNYLLFGQLLTNRQSFGVFFIFLAMIVSHLGSFLKIERKSEI